MDVTVTVAIPSYRGGAMLAAAVRSVLAQTHADFDLVVIDDASPDDSVAAAVAAAGGDPRVRVLRNPHNLGPQGNWNRCLDEARGSYFKLLPHDDLLHPECLAEQVSALEADRDRLLAFAFCARDVLGPDGRVLARRGFPGASMGRIAADRIVAGCVRRGTNLVGEPGAVLMRTALARRAGPFDARNPYVIDLDYWFRLLALGDAHYSPRALASFRVSSTQWSVTIGASQASDFRRFIDRVTESGSLSATLFDRACGRVTPALNNLARLAFYKVHLR